MDSIQNIIYDYEDVGIILKHMEQDEINLVPFHNQTKYNTKFGYPIYHYVIGSGKNHIVLLGGTHGNEIIGTHFLLHLIDQILHKKGLFEHYDSSQYSIDVIPIQNPEGYILTMDAVRMKIKHTTDLKIMETVCHQFYECFKDDDCFSKENPDDRSPKQHQKFVEKVFSHHSDLYEAGCHILENGNLPIGTLISWRANGSGIDLNRNTPYQKRKETRPYILGQFRYNNMSVIKPSPLGTRSQTNPFTHELENVMLKCILDQYQSEGILNGIISYHSAGGYISYRLYQNMPISLLNEEERIRKNKNNLILAKIYSKHSGYQINYQMTYGCFDDELRFRYPNVLLIELSKMGAYPLGPFGDLKTMKKY